MFLQLLFQVLFDGLVDYFYPSIILGVLRGREHFLNSKLFTKGDEAWIVKLLPIIRDHDMWEPEPTNDVLPQEIGVLYICLLR